MTEVYGRHADLTFIQKLFDNDVKWGNFKVHFISIYIVYNSYVWELQFVTAHYAPVPFSCHS